MINGKLTDSNRNHIYNRIIDLGHHVYWVNITDAPEGTAWFGDGLTGGVRHRLANEAILELSNLD